MSAHVAAALALLEAAQLLAIGILFSLRGELRGNARATIARHEDRLYALERDVGYALAAHGLRRSRLGLEPEAFGSVSVEEPPPPREEEPRGG